MKVKEMMHTGAEYVAPNAKLEVVAKKMRDYDVGSIPVCDGEKLIGIVTDRDIAIRAIANGRDVGKLEAKDVMSKDVIFCRDNENAEDAIRIMEDNQIRRLAVLNRELGADFEVDRFAHRAVWDAENSWIEMRLLATEPMTVKLPEVDLVVDFAAGEQMRTEISTKFTPDGVAGDLERAGLAVAGTWTDPAGDYLLTLARPG